MKDYIDEEIGHEQWILEDLAECGVDPAAVARSSPGFEVEQLVSYVYDFINRRNPVGFLGMVYVLEGTSTELATETARLAQAKLGLPSRDYYLGKGISSDSYLTAYCETLSNALGFAAVPA